MREDWAFARLEPTDELVRLHYFSLTVQQDGAEIEFLITVREHEATDDQAMRFVATADKRTNQKTAPYEPKGWGANVVDALAQCIREIHRFPYEGTSPAAASSETTPPEEATPEEASGEDA